jgi:hypothetical protein
MISGGVQWVRTARTLVRTFGLRGAYRRALHEIRRRGDLYQRHPTSRAYTGVGTRAVRYRPSDGWNDLTEAQRTLVVERGQRVLAGWYQAYGGEWRRMPETNDDWYSHPTVGFRFAKSDWWKLEVLSEGVDIKDVWEPARFGWVYDLIRAYSATGEDVYAACFYERLRAWHDANPPFQGPQWSCGQEAAIRALAILHAEDSMPDSRQAALLVSILCWSAERIANAIGYGLSQRNNHGISESAALVHLGLRLADIHPQAKSWLRRGRRWLNEQICDQFSSDGWYSQHSFTYTRLALEQSLYAQRALAAVGSGLSAQALALLDAATSFLTSLIDSGSGELPNHGANDGSRVLPFSTAPYRDFRPTLTLAALIRSIPLAADIAPDTDVVRWLGGQLPVPSPPRHDGIYTGRSGWVAGRVSTCSFFLRAGTYRHRPSHLDSLHLDVRIDGKEIVTDAGTYAYNAGHPWNNGLADADVHNGPLLLGEELAERGPRFLWLSWPGARVLTTKYTAGKAHLIAERPGVVRREIVVEPGCVRVRDTSLSRDARPLQVTWLLHPDTPMSAVYVEGGQMLPASEKEVTGWYSPTYGIRRRSAAVRVIRRMEECGGSIETVIRSS